MGKTEQVLVVKRSVIQEIGLFQGMCFEFNRYLGEFWKGTGISFVSRSEAEGNPAYKQLIPYVIMSYEDTYLCYIRGKEVDEPRLAERISMGIGGHINPSDTASCSSTNIRDIYFNAVAREVAEEVVVDTAYDARIVGLINDDSNDVGQVHFGIVHCWRLEKPEVRSGEHVICELEFMEIDKLVEIKDKMESWSRLCLENLHTISGKTHNQ